MTPREALDRAEALLLDFDGPMAQLMPPPRNRQAADLVRQALGDEVPVGLADSTDHIALLAYPGISDEARTRAEQAATEFEVECARTCAPATWLSGLLAYARRRDLPLAVVTNNSPQAVRAFLARPGIGALIEVICGRTAGTIGQLKPDPRFLLDALSGVGVGAPAAVFIGDSVSDVHAGQAAGIPVVGYAKNQSRAESLRAAGAIAIEFSGPQSH